MRSLDVKSILVAGLIGAVALWAIGQMLIVPAGSAPTPSTEPPPFGSTAGTGFAVGAVVQIGVRLLGVS
jgi:hypothetical protein